MASASSVTVNAQFAAGRVAQFRARRSASRSSSAVRSSVKVRAGAPTYEEEFDGNTGQAVQILWQSVETCDAGGITWSYRLGEADPEFTPEEGAEPIETKVLLVHGAGLAAYNYRKLMRDLQEKGYQCFAPDLPGHGDTSKPGSFGYDAKSYMDALEAFIGAAMGDAPVDLVVSGFITSQYALLLAAAKPQLFRKVVILNMPLDNGHKLPGPLATFTRPFGMGKGSKADVYNLAYFGNEFAIPPEDMAKFEAPYTGSDGEAARAALEATVVNADYKGLVNKVKDAWGQRGPPKARMVWGMDDKYLSQEPMVNFADLARANFDIIRKVGHMPHEDFPQEAGKFVANYLAQTGKVSALGSVRVGKIRE